MNDEKKKFIPDLVGAFQVNLLYVRRIACTPQLKLSYCFVIRGLIFFIVVPITTISVVYTHRKRGCIVADDDRAIYLLNGVEGYVIGLMNAILRPGNAIRVDTSKNVLIQVAAIPKVSLICF